MLAFELESEIIRQVPALVISSKEPQRRWIPDLQSPQIQDTLDEDISSYAKACLSSANLPRC